PAGADELLGLASALLPLGTAGIVASVAQVNDRAAAPLMLALHRRLRSAGPAREPAQAPSPPRCATPGRRLSRRWRRPGGDRGRRLGKPATSADVKGMTTDEIMDLLRAE